jgi:hypothetical protein
MYIRKRRCQLVEKIKYATLVLFAEGEKVFVGGVRERATEIKKSYFNGWRNSFLPPVSYRAAAAATSFFRLLSKKPGEVEFFDSPLF